MLNAIYFSANIQIESAGKSGIVSIYGIEAQRYLSMNRRGKVQAIVSNQFLLHCIFFSQVISMSLGTL